MKELNIKRVFSIISAICFLAYGIWNFIHNLSYINNSYNTDSNNFISIVGIILSIAFCMLAVTFMLNKKNNILLGASGFYLLMCIILIFGSSGTGNILRCLASATLFIDILYNVVPSLKKFLNITKILSFIPAILIVISFIVNVIQISNSFSSNGLDFRMSDLSSSFIIGTLLLIIGYLFAGLWLSNFEFGKAKNTTTATQYQPVQQKKTSDADKLLTYKRLLDNGSITQEEFEQKKSEVLNNK